MDVEVAHHDVVGDAVVSAGYFDAGTSGQPLPAGVDNLQPMDGKVVGVMHMHGISRCVEASDDRMASFTIMAYFDTFLCRSFACDL